VDPTTQWLVAGPSQASEAYPIGPPAVAEVVAGPGATSTLAAASLSGGTLDYEWDNVTVQPGASVAFLHFTSQHATTAATVATAQRLVQLPPEALEGLTVDDIAEIKNFEVPANGVSTLPPLTPPLTGSVSGSVVDGDGITPVQNASVTVSSGDLIFGKVVSGTTDSNGLYSVTGVPIEGYNVAVVHPVTATLSPSFSGNFASGAPSAQTNVVFSNTGQVQGVFVGADGVTPIVGANINLQNTNNNTLAQGVMTGSDGKFSISGVLQGSYTVAGVIPEATLNFTGTQVQATAPVEVLNTQTTNVTLELAPTGTVSGTITGATGAPEAASVTLANTKQNFSRSSTSNSSGVYLFPYIPPGSYSVTAYDPATGAPVTATANVTANATATVNLQFAGLGTVNVTVEKAGGTVAANSQVEINYGAGFNYTGLTTDSNGTAILQNVPIAPFTVRAWYPGSTSGQVYSDQAGSFADGMTSTAVTVTLPAAGTVQGQLTLPGGAGANNASLYLASNTSTNYFYQFATTDTGGNYSITPVPANVPMTLTAYRPGTSVQITVPNVKLTSDGQTLTENVPLPAYASATVTVEDASSKPISGADVYLTDDESRQYFEGATNSSGQLSLSTVVGNYAVAATTYNSATFTSSYLGTTAGTVSAAQDGGSIQIVVKPATSTGTVSGHVYGGTGTTPLIDLSVQLQDAATGLEIASTVTDSNGAYSFSNVTVGSSFAVYASVALPYQPYSVSATQTVSFTSKGQSVTLDLTLPMSVVEGKVFRHDGVTTVDGAQVFGSQTASDGTMLGFYGASDSNGNYQVLGMEAAAYTLTASYYTGLQGNGSGTLASATSTDTVNLSLQAAGTVTGTVKDTNGNLLTNKDLTVTTSSESVQLSTETAGNGVYTLSDVGTGAVQVEYFDGTTLVGKATGTLAADGDTLTLNLQLSGGTVSGVIYESDGKTPAAGVPVTVVNYDAAVGGISNSVQVNANSSGAYSASNLLAGTIHVNVLNTSPAASGVSQTQLTAGGTATGNVTLGTAASFDATSKTANLDGPDGYRYDVDCQGRLLKGGTTSGSEPAFDIGEALLFENLPAPCYLQYQSELSGREVTLGETEIDGFYVTRKAFSPPGGGYTRYLEYVRNPGTTATYVYFDVEGTLVSGATTSVVVDPSTTNNTYGIYGTTGTKATPNVGFLLTDANQGSQIAYFYLPSGSGSYDYSYSVPVPANGTAIVMHFVAQNNDPNQVETTMQNLLTLSDPDALDGLSAVEKSEIVNFTNANLGVGSPGDGIADGRNGTSSTPAAKGAN